MFVYVFVYVFLERNPNVSYAVGCGGGGEGLLTLGLWGVYAPCAGYCEQSAGNALVLGGVIFSMVLLIQNCKK